MSNETLFFICGGILAVSAISVSFVGLKLPNFPGKALPLVILWFALFVVGATTFAVLHAKDEEKAKAAEVENPEEVQKSAPYETEGAEGTKEEPSESTEGEAGKKPSKQAKASGKGAAAQQGSSSKPSGGEASTTLQLEASPTELAFNTTQLSAKAGKVTIDFTNPSPLEHNVVIEQNGKELASFEPIAEGKASESATLKPGTYTFFCAVPGHRQAGMEGTLVVK